MTALKNIPASVRDRLLHLARTQKRPFNELLQYYGMERFLYRLSQSSYADRFILKGALMLRVWQAPALRPTMDIDMLGRTSNQADEIALHIREILATGVEPDGLVYDADSIHLEQITEEADYTGVRVRFRATLDTARLNLQRDIGFGDIVHPAPEQAAFPTLLDYPGPTLLCYSRESVIAEKFEAMVKLGMLNSRMKDFYDIWLLARQFSFDEAQLAEAIRLTFNQRATPLPTAVEAFEPDFIEAKQGQWTAFAKRLKQEQIPASFAEIIAEVKKLLMPVLARLL